MGVLPAREPALQVVEVGQVVRGTGWPFGKGRETIRGDGGIIGGLESGVSLGLAVVVTGRLTVPVRRPASRAGPALPVSGSRHSSRRPPQTRPGIARSRWRPWPSLCAQFATFGSACQQFTDARHAKTNQLAVALSSVGDGIEHFGLIARQRGTWIELRWEGGQIRQQVEPSDRSHRPPPNSVELALQLLGLAVQVVGAIAVQVMPDAGQIVRAFALIVFSVQLNGFHRRCKPLEVVVSVLQKL